VVEGSSREVPSAEAVGALEYHNPPLVETSLGVGFSPIRGWSLQHFGLYYGVVRSSYPRFEQAAPITLGRSNTATPFLLPSKLRTFFSNADRTRLIQLQDDLFFLNWQRMVSEQKYPRYAQQRNALLAEWVKFGTFLDQNDLPRPMATRYQMTYVNAIEHPNEGATPLELSDVYSSWRPHARGTFAAFPSDVSTVAHYLIGDVELTYSVQSALRLTDQKRVLQFTLTGGIQASTGGDIDIAVMDRIHTSIAQGFEEFTSERAKRVWGKI
jgi:uncharacterized protein (TIGR04255 family)